MSKLNLGTGLLLALLMSVAPVGFAETIYLVTAHNGVKAYDSEYFANQPKAQVDKVLQAKAVTFNITYLDGATSVGFGTGHPESAARRARLEEALAYVADTLEATGTLDVRVEVSEMDGGGALAFAGTFFSSAVGYQNGSAFTRLTTGVKPFVGTPEIHVTVDFGWSSPSWNSTLNAPTNSQVDLLSVLIHEVTHGMGILSLSGATGSGSISGAPNTYAVFDKFIRRANTGNLLFNGTSPNFFTGTSADLISNNLDWDGTAAKAAFGSRPPVNAPGTFQSGSSLSHWEAAPAPS